MKIKHTNDNLFEDVYFDVDWDNLVPTDVYENNDYIWVNSLEEDLEEYMIEETAESRKNFVVGDIVMPAEFVSEQSSKRNKDDKTPKKDEKVKSPHRIIVVNKAIKSDGATQYFGFLLSSQMSKANKYGGYPDNIFIANYADILESGRKDDKEAFVRVDDIVTFTTEMLSPSGSWKGHVTDDFMKFLKKCRDNFVQHRSNANMYYKK